jgi:ABC-type phosphate transport system permease subunit
MWREKRSLVFTECGHVVKLHGLPSIVFGVRVFFSFVNFWTEENNETFSLKFSK